MKALIVDDEPYNVDLIRELLEAEDWQISTACNGEEAVQCFKTDQPDLVLMDVRMPGMNGIEAMQAIRCMDAGKKTPIICITAKAMKGDRQSLLTEGFDAYIGKPIDPWTLVQEIENIMQQAAQHSR